MLFWVFCSTTHWFNRLSYSEMQIVVPINCVCLLTWAPWVGILNVMYFRRKTTPTGCVVQLIESFRDVEGNPRQRIVVSLGNARLPLSLQAPVAQGVEEHLRGRVDLFRFGVDEDTGHWIDYVIRRIDAKPAGVEAGAKKDTGMIDGVLVDKIEHETTTELGPELVALHAWRKLGMDSFLQALGFNELQRMTALASVINRLVDPVSEHRLAPWVAHSSLAELVGEKVLRDGDDRYYRVSDNLLHHRDVIEGMLRERQADLFSLDRTIVLYDLTNTHFEGVCRDNPKAKRGRNKQKRHDCPQVVIGMVFDGDGFELAHRVFEGTQSDSKSLVMMVDALREAVGHGDVGVAAAPGATPLVIVDAGVATRQNLRLLGTRGFSYLVNDSRRGRTKYADLFKETDGFEMIAGRGKRPSVMVRIVQEHEVERKECSDEGLQISEQLVLCKSAARSEKERAIISRAEERFREDLEQLARRVREGRLVDVEKVQRSVGGLQRKHRRVARYYDVEVNDIAKRTRSLSWHRKDEVLAQMEPLYGCYVLRTNQRELEAAQLWSLYITLTRAEEGFRALKSNLGLRPNRHQKEHRVEGHIFISILAYHLMCYIMRVLEDEGDNRHWETIRRVLQSHSYTTMILPTKQGKVYRVRKAGTPEECQKSIYAKLKVDWRNLPSSRTVFTHKPSETL